MGKVFAYARVSTPRQGEKGVSLQEQRAAIERYADQHSLEIVRWFEERETAAKTGRGQFTKMVRLLRLRTAQGVIIHKIDRSARNLQDWADLGKLVDAGADIHFAIENLDLKTVAGRLSADIQAVVAAHYSRNLREEAKKGFYGRLKQGFYPLCAPIGYLDQGAARPKVPDPLRAPLVREAFKLYSTGKFALPELVNEMLRRGLRNRQDGRVSLNGLARMLKNPFYTGIIRLRKSGESFRGKHEPLIDARTFEKVQEVLAGRRVDRIKNKVFTYSRILRCANCGYSLIAEEQKGHIYYRCHNRAFKTPFACPPTSIREDRIDEAVVATLARIDLDDQDVQAVRLLAQERRLQTAEESAAEQEALRLRFHSIEDRLSKLADLLLEGAIERPLYQAKQRALLAEQVAVEAQMQQAPRSTEAVIAQLEKIVELAKSPSMLYKTASVAQKRELLKTLLSNLTASSKNVVITLSLAFRLIAERERNAQCGANRGTCRTWERLFQQLQTLLINPSSEPSRTN